MVHEEAATLLDGAPAPQPTSTRRSLVRVALGVVSAAALVVGSVVAVDQLRAGQQHQQMTTTNLRAVPHAAPLMEAQFGWGTINNAWCSVRAGAGCLFSSDKEKCREEVHEKCDSKEEEAEAPAGDGSGSGSGSMPGAEVGAVHKKRKHHGRKHHKKPEGPPPPPPPPPPAGPAEGPAPGAEPAVTTEAPAEPAPGPGPDAPASEEPAATTAAP